MTDGSELLTLLARLGEPDRDKRIKALRELMELKDRRCLEMVIPLASDRDARVREHAIGVLVSVCDRRATDVLIAALQDPVTRQEAIRGLGVIGDPRAWDAIVAVLDEKVWDLAMDTLESLVHRDRLPQIRDMLQEKDPCRRAAGIQLVKTATQKLEPEVFRLAMQDESLLVRRAALEQWPCYFTQDRAVVPDLLAALRQEELRELALNALEPWKKEVWRYLLTLANDMGGAEGGESGEISNAALLERLFRVKVLKMVGDVESEEVLAFLLKSLDDPAPELRAAAFGELISWSGNPAVREQLKQAYRKEEDKCARKEMKDLIRWHNCYFPEEEAICPGGKGVTRLLDQWCQGNEYERSRALEQLRSCQDSRAIEVLVEGTRDPAARNRVVAIQGLMVRLMEGTRDPIALNRFVRIKRLMLRESRDERILLALLAALKDPEQGVRETAVEALGWLGGQRAEEALIRLAGEKELRIAALEALRHMNAREAEVVFQQALGDQQGRVRALAARGVQDERAIPVLRQMLVEDPCMEARMQAARALGRLRAEEAIEELSDCLEREVIPVKRAVLRALRQIGGPEAKEALRRARQDIQAIRKTAKEELCWLEKEEGWDVL